MPWSEPPTSVRTSKRSDMKIFAILILICLSACNKLELNRSNSDIVVVCKAVEILTPTGKQFHLDHIQVTKGSLPKVIIDPTTGFLVWSKTLPANASASGYFEVYLKLKPGKSVPTKPTSLKSLFLFKASSMPEPPSESGGRELTD